MTRCESRFDEFAFSFFAAVVECLRRYRLMTNEVGQQLAKILNICADCSEYAIEGLRLGGLP